MKWHGRVGRYTIVFMMIAINNAICDSLFFATFVWSQAGMQVLVWTLTLSIMYVLDMLPNIPLFEDVQNPCRFFLTEYGALLPGCIRRRAMKSLSVLKVASDKE